MWRFVCVLADACSVKLPSHGLPPVTLTAGASFGTEKL